MPDESLWSLVSRTVNESGSIEKAVFFLLLGLSLVSWCILLLKIHDLYLAKKNSDKLLLFMEGSDNFGTVLSAEPNLGPSPLLSIFKAAVHALENMPVLAAPGKKVEEARRIPLKPVCPTDDLVLLSMQHTAKAEFMKLQKGLGFLATVGSTSPFIGLFGTIWGIMNTFRELGNAKSASLAVVAPGISSALIATAAGLAVAIPAVMSYNWFLSQIDSLQENSDSFIERVNLLIRASGLHVPGSEASSSVVNAYSPHVIAASPVPAPMPQPRGPQA